MEYLNMIADEFNAYLDQNGVSFPLSQVGLSLLKEWKYVHNLEFDMLDDWSSNDAVPSISRLRGMIQDQHEPQIVCSVFIEDGVAFPSIYGREPASEEAEFIDGIFHERFPVTVVSNSMSTKLPTVYFYEDSLKLNQMIDVVGIYTKRDEFHVIQEIPNFPSIKDKRMREVVLSALCKALGGDNLVSELILYTLISKTHMREGLIGYLPINITKVTAPSLILDCINALTDASTLPLSLEFLNDSKLNPEKIDESFEKTPLQLPPNSVLNLDETELTAGELTQKGIQNLRILSMLLNDQSLVYSFNHCDIPFATDFRILVFSESSSILKVPLQVPLEKQSQSEYAPVNQAMIDYVKACFEHNVEMTEDVSKLAQGYFIRKREDDGILADDLHLILTLTRYVAKSYFADKTTPEHWNRAVTIFDEIRQRNS